MVAGLAGLNIGPLALLQMASGMLTPRRQGGGLGAGLAGLSQGMFADMQMGEMQRKIAEDKAQQTARARVFGGPAPLDRATDGGTMIWNQGRTVSGMETGDIPMQGPLPAGVPETQRPTVHGSQFNPTRVALHEQEQMADLTRAFPREMAGAMIKSLTDTDTVNVMGPDGKIRTVMKRGLPGYIKLGHTVLDDSIPESLVPGVQANRLEVAREGRSLTNMQIDQRGETAHEVAYGTETGKEAATIHAAANSSRNRLAQLDQLDALIENVPTGKLAPYQATLGSWLEAVGIDPAKVGIDPKAPMTAEGVTAITNAMTVGMIGPGGFPANNFSDADRKFLQQTMPQMVNTVGGNYIVSQALRAAAFRNIEKEERFLQARAEGKDFPTFLREWNAYIKKAPLFPRVDSLEEVQQLRSGTIFVDPTGQVRVKP